MNKKPFFSLIIFMFLLVLIITSGLLFFNRHTTITAALHTSIGFLFVLAIIFHIKNNLKALLSYIFPRKKTVITRLPLIFSVLLTGFISAGIYFESKPLMSLFKYGESIRSQKDLKADEDKIEYKVITTKKTSSGTPITVEVTKGAKDYYSVMAIWIEDTSGNYIETIYASNNIATGTFYNHESKRVSVRRPEAIPYWSHKRNIIENDGLNVPTPENKLPDALTSATPKSHFKLNSSLSKYKTSTIRVLYEVNRSFDWNEYYHENAFPNDSIYSGSGAVGQPSLIYSTEDITLNIDEKEVFLMRLMGHGHHSGRDGKLYTDLSKITSAKSITERVLVFVNP